MTRRYQRQPDHFAPTILHALANVYYGRGGAIPRDRERIKRRAIQQRRWLHQQQVA